MTIAYGSLAQGTGTGTSILTSSISPGANKLVLIGIETYNAATTVATPSGNGLTWEAIFASANWSDSATRALWRTMGPAPSAGQVTIALSLSATALWSIIEFDGVDTSGANGAGAIVQTKSQNAFGQTSVLATLAAAFGSPNNMAYGFCSYSAATAITVGSGFTQAHSQADANRRCLSEYKLNDTGVDASAASGNFSMLALEIKAAVAGGVTQAQLDGASMRGVDRGVQRGLARRIVTTNWKRHGSGLFVPAFTGLIAQPAR